MQREGDRLDVGAVHRKSRDELHDPFGELRARERSRARIGARDRREEARETLHVRGERAPQDERLGAHGDLVEVEVGVANVEEGAVALLDLATTGGIDEDGVELREKFVAGGAGHGPPGAEPLAPGENLFDEHRDLGARQHLLDGGIQAIEIVARVSQAIDVVDAQAVELTVLHPLDDAPVRRAEDGGILHAQRDELVDVEEAAVVDLVRGPSPEDERVDLRAEEGGDARVAAMAGGEGARGVIERAMHHGRALGERFEATEELGRLLLPARDERWARRIPRWQRGERVAYARELGGIPGLRVPPASPRGRGASTDGIVAGSSGKPRSKYRTRKRPPSSAMWNSCAAIASESSEPSMGMSTRPSRPREGEFQSMSNQLA